MRMKNEVVIEAAENKPNLVKINGNVMIASRGRGHSKNKPYSNLTATVRTQK